MANGKNGKLANWQIDKLATGKMVTGDWQLAIGNWQNGKLAKMANWQTFALANGEAGNWQKWYLATGN
jgi:hypothetical protein